MATLIPDVVRNQSICALRETASVAEAARRMGDHDIGAIVVVDDRGHLSGIVTERDVTRRAVAERLDPDRTTVGQIMTRNPDSLPPQASPIEALELMSIRRFRHLPVVEAGRVVGIVSIRDLCDVMRLILEEFDLGDEATLFEDLSGG
ncbi:MAG: CBS domain-containing protein [Rhodospirillales bacterium]